LPQIELSSLFQTVGNKTKNSGVRIMKSVLRKLMPAFILLFFATTVLLASEDIDNFYYARCNLKILKGKLITWVNWQASPEFLPVGSKVTLVLNGRKATVTDVETKRNCTLDMGAAGPQFLSKFFVSEPVSIQGFPEDTKANIRNAVARVGMTKLQAYMAMGAAGLDTIRQYQCIDL
jgi:hypothetical protein